MWQEMPVKSRIVAIPAQVYNGPKTLPENAMMAKQKERLTMSRAFLEGLARIFDPFSNLDRRRYRSSFHKTVAGQFQEDWETIGQDIQTVFGEWKEQEQESFPHRR